MKRDARLPQKRPTPESLAEAAIAYLARFAASESDVRRVLKGRVRRAAQRDPALAEDETALAALFDSIEPIIARHRATGTLDDTAFAAMKVRSGRNRGRSARQMEAALVRKGVASAVIRDALAPEDEDMTAEDAELQAARQFARRRRLGGFRKQDADTQDSRLKDLAAFARAGFSRATAQQALKSDNES